MFKRSILTTFAIVLLLVMLPLSAVSAQNPDCEGDVTLTYWHHWGGNRIPLQEHQVAAFEDAHPGICVDNIFLPWDNRLAEPAGCHRRRQPARCDDVRPA